MDGKLYGIPLGVNAMGTTYDAAMLKEAGITAIPKNWTWSDLEQIAKRLKAKGKVLDHMRFDQFFLTICARKISTILARMVRV